MTFCRFCATLAVCGGLSLCAAPADHSGDASGNGANSDRPAATGAPRVPPVLRDHEPSDTGELMLPGAAPTAPQPAPVKTIAVKTAAVAPTTPRPDPDRPILRRAPRPAYPVEFQNDSAGYCHKMIGQWTAAQARALFGAPKSERPAYDDHEAVNGEILAFSDPTARYRQIELDFDSDSGNLRTVFVYPWKMTWQDCRRAFGVNVTATDANKGRKFYSYVNRRLDVLVDSTGQVISLGMY